MKKRIFAAFMALFLVACFCVPAFASYGSTGYVYEGNGIYPEIINACYVCPVCGSSHTSWSDFEYWIDEDTNELSQYPTYLAFCESCGSMGSVNDLVNSFHTVSVLGDLPIGSKVKIPHTEMGDIVFVVADRGIYGDTTTFISDSLVCLRPFDARELDSTNSYHSADGDTRYCYSNLDLWLNSSAGAGEWYVSRHTDDHAPDVDTVSRNPYADDTGFLYGFSSSFVKSLVETSITVNVPVGYGGGYEVITRKIFLPSRMEIYGEDELGISEGVQLSYFAVGNVKQAKVSLYASLDNDNKGSSSVMAGSYRYFWLRTAKGDSYYYCRLVGANGELVNNTPKAGDGGVRPMFNLSNDISVSAFPDNDGCYTLDFHDYEGKSCSHCNGTLDYYGYCTSCYQNSVGIMSAGYCAGNSVGYSDGYSLGYQNGFSLGEESNVSENIGGLLTSVALTPFQALVNMFDFQIFGINIAKAILSLFTFLVVIAILVLLVKIFI